MKPSIKTILSFPVLLFASAYFFSIPVRAQFTGGSTGLLQMPTAEMQTDGTFMLSANFLNKHSLPTGGWNYNTFQYGLYVSYWGRIEIGYILTIFNGKWDPTPEDQKSRRQKIMRNQDRHFTGRICLLREEAFGLSWMPALVIGIIDPVSGSASREYIGGDLSGAGNGFFNRNFIVMTKHFQTPWGQFGTHVGYQYNRRTDYPINGPCVGVDWTPVWIQNEGVFDNAKFILEYDSRTVNMGFIASIWENRFEAMFELQNFRWVNFGIRYKVRLKIPDQ